MRQALRQDAPRLKVVLKPVLKMVFKVVLKLARKVAPKMAARRERHAAPSVAGTISAPSKGSKSTLTESPCLPPPRMTPKIGLTSP